MNEYGGRVGHGFTTVEDHQLPLAQPLLERGPFFDILGVDPLGFVAPSQLHEIQVIESSTLEMKNNVMLLGSASIFFPGVK